MLYPSNSRLLIGLSGTASTVSSMLPLFWYHLIVSTSLTFSNIMVIWGSLTFISLVICIFIGPWHNLKHFPEGETLQKLISKDISTKSTNLDRAGLGGSGMTLSWFTRFIFLDLPKYLKSTMCILQFLFVIVGQITSKFFFRFDAH